MKSFILTAVRHGETDYNLSLIVKSEADTDYSLNEKGRKQGNLLGERLKEEKFTKAFTSHLIRTKETAECIFSTSLHQPQPNLIVDERIREREIGPSKVGSKFADWTTEAMQWARENNRPPFHFDPIGVESYADLTNRISSFLKELCEEELVVQTPDGAPPNNILIVSHGLWILCLLNTLTGSTEFEFDEAGSVPREQVLKNLIHNTAVTKIRIGSQLNLNSKRKVQIFLLNDHSHLESL